MLEGARVAETHSIFTVFVNFPLALCVLLDGKPEIS